MSDQNNVVVIEPTSLSVNINERALADLKIQRQQLKEFIRSELVKTVDFGVIPGTPKPSLLKPGAEKLQKLFKLGSRIVWSDRVIDKDNDFVMLTYRIEIFHLPTGAVLCQCEGSANSLEKKFKSRPGMDQLNSLGKMAQKRAFVGGIISATGASDFFTQDVEDGFEDKAGNIQSQAAPQQKAAQTVAPGKEFCNHCGSTNTMVSIHQANTIYCRDCKKTQARA